MATSNKAVLGFPRWTDKAVVAEDTGASSAANYPASNLNTLPLAQVWRSASAAVANTKFVATLDKQRSVRLLALVGHNCSLAATVRIRLYSDAAAAALLYDSGIVDVWPVVYPFGALEWWQDNWWTGKYTAEEIAGYRWTRPFWLDQIYFTRTIRVEISDPTNAAGYVECGLFEIAQGTQATVNFGFGASYGFRFRTASVEALGGAKYFERRDKPRVFKGEVQHLPRDEAMSSWFELHRQLDLDTPFLWLPNPNSTVNLLRECFLARTIDPGLLAYASPGRDRIPISLEEVL